MGQRKNIFDPHNQLKNYDPGEMLTYVKKISPNVTHTNPCKNLTHATYATHGPTDPQNPCDLAGSSKEHQKFMKIKKHVKGTRFKS